MSKIDIGKTYRHKDVGYYAKALAVLLPNQGENTNKYTVVKCGWAQMPNDSYVFIKYLKPGALEEIK